MYYYYYGYSQIEQLLNKLKTDRFLSFEDFKLLLESTYTLLQEQIENSESYNLALSVICHVSEYLPNDLLLQELLSDCIISSRVFLYRDMLESKSTEFAKQESSHYEDFARAFYTLDTNTTLTRDQKKLFNYFQRYRRIVVSAPTSFGKSRIISEIINHNNYSNIAIILPTIALLAETFVRFRKDNKISQKYNLVNSLKQPLNDKNNILIFTPEKIDLFLDENPKFKVDFFAMDEIYKIQDDGDRSKVFTNSLYRLSKSKASFYLIGPYFDKFSPEFLNKTEAQFFRFSAEIVQKDIIDLTEHEPKEMIRIGNVRIKNGKAETNLRNILKETNEQALVYVGDKRGVESKAKLIANDLKYIDDKSGLIAYLEATFSRDWSLVQCLKKGIAFHHAGIPKFIQTEIVDSFNSGDIKTIVCSPTLIEGVNTSAKQVIIYSDNKGKDLLTDFDVKNINGRAGRFLQHFLGRSIALTRLPKNKEEKIIEFSFFDKDLDNDELAQVDKEDLKQGNLIKRQKLEDDLKSQRIPLEIIKKNKFIPVENQIKFITHLRQQIYYYNLTNNGLPSREQYKTILNLIHTYLFADKYKEDRKIPIWDLIYHSSGYIYHNITLKQLIEQQKGATIDTKIRTALDLLTRYFEFALPKYLTVFQNLFNFVCEELNLNDRKTNLDLLVIKLEYGVTESHEIALKDAGLPTIIIRNISEAFKGCQDINEIRARFFNDPGIISRLHPYEQIIFEKHI
jgi:helicase